MGEKNYIAIALVNIGAKILNKITENQNQVGFIPGRQRWFNICKSLNLVHCFNTRKNKKQKLPPVDKEINIWQVQHPFMIQSFNKLDFTEVIFSAQ
jgi:hypothetical protein